MATTDPSSLFITAALAAGIVEGSSVIRYHRRELLRQSGDDGDSVGNSTNDDDGVGIAADSASKNDVQRAPSIPAVAVNSFIYGAASVPLGLVGASPGLVFLPRSLVNGGKSSPENTTNEVEKQAVDDELNDLPHAATSDTQIVAGTGRGVGRMLRHENSRKIIHNKRQRRNMETQLTNRNKIVPADTASSSMTSTYSRVSSRYIATLDGAPLPTMLAEAMRRSRCMFIGAGLVSYALTEYYLSEDRSKQTRDSLEISTNGNITLGYDHWIRNGNSIGLWNERIKNGRSVNDMEFQEKLQTNNDVGDDDKNGVDIHGISSDILSIIGDAQDVVFHGIYDAMRWINLQLEKDQKTTTDANRDATIGTNASLNAGEREVNPSPDLAKSNQILDDNTSDSQQPSQKQSSKVWQVAVTSVDVLGTSIRHLLVSTYGIASAVATLGQKRRVGEKEENKAGDIGKATNTTANNGHHDDTSNK